MKKCCWKDETTCCIRHCRISSKQIIVGTMPRYFRLDFHFASLLYRRSYCLCVCVCVCAVWCELHVWLTQYDTSKQTRAFKSHIKQTTTMATISSNELKNSRENEMPYMNQHRLCYTNRKKKEASSTRDHADLCHMIWHVKGFDRLRLYQDVKHFIIPHVFTCVP